MNTSSKRCTVVALAMTAVLMATICLAQGPKGLPKSITSEVKTPRLVPAGTYTFVRSWKANYEGHNNTGRLVKDPQASDGHAWEVLPGTDAPAMAVYGPYIDVKPGDYMAFFRVKLLEAPEGDLAATIDACIGYGSTPLVQHDIAGSDLTVGKYVEVPLAFHDPGGLTEGLRKLEVRLNWPGDLGLHIDKISLFRVTGVDLSKVGRVPQPTESGKPNNLPYYTEPRPFGSSTNSDIFPRSAPPAKTLVVCDLRKVHSDLRLTLYCLQGLVNRTQPRLYLLSVTNDDFWLANMKKRGWIKRTEVVTQPLDLLTRFRSSFKGVIITDPLLPATKNVATMLAGVLDGLAVSPRLAKQLKLPVLEDLRGRFKTNVEAYRWSFNTLWPKLNHHVLACAYPDQLALRDYLVENKVFIFWLSGPIDGAEPYANPDAEVRLMEQLFAKMPANIPILSYPYAGKDIGIGEGGGVTLFAEFAKYLVGSIDCSNLSVHSGIQVGPLHQRPAPPTPKLDESKVYLTWLMSDGDNLPVLSISNFPQLWASKLRGKFPIGWTMSPSAEMLMPDIVDYYFRTESPNDRFMCAVSGIGYTYPDHYGTRYRPSARRKVLDQFMAQTATYMKRSDENEIWIIGATKPAEYAFYADKIPFLKAIFPDYGKRVTSYTEATSPTARNIPVFCSVNGMAQDFTREQRIAEVVRDIREMTPAQKPAFMQAFALNWFTDLPMLQEILKKLGPEYVCVRPDHLAELWQEEMARRRVYVRVLPTAACIEGVPLKLTGSARNMTEKTLDVALHLGPGFADGKLSLTRALIKPAQQVDFSISGRPVADTATLDVTGSFGSRQASVALRRIAAADIVGRLPKLPGVVPVAYLEAETLAHRDGHSVSDPTASAGTEWVATKGKTKPDTIVFGPYSSLPQGRYLALFRVKRLDAGTGVLAQLDTCVGGGHPETGLRELKCDELPVGQWKYVPIIFNHPGGPYETRVTWSGAASIAVDCIPVWRIEAN